MLYGMYIVTGATGHLGRFAIQELLARGIDAGQIVALARTPERASDLAALGVVVREADYGRPETLGPALAGTRRLLLVSGSEVGQRVVQHGNVIDAAVAAGVESIAYTSMVNADTTGIGLAADHQATEKLLARAGVPVTLLRNAWYIENYTDNLAQTLQHGAVLGAAGDGRVSGATRADFAAAAAAALVGEEHVGATFELGGDPAFTLGDLAAAITQAAGTTVVYRNLPPAELVAVLAAGGVPQPFAEALADADQGIARGDLFTDTGDLAKLLGRPPVPFTAAVAAAVAALR